MRVELAAICDAATESGGKLNLLGAFDSIQVAEYPFVVPHCSLVFRIRFNRVECGAHQIKVAFVDQDGKELIPSLEADVNIPQVEGIDSRVTNLIMSLNGFTIKEPGKFSIDLAIDGRHEISLPLTARQLPKE